MALIQLEIWSHEDMINVTDNPYSTLGAFLAWRRKQLSHLPNDNAHLITLVPENNTHSHFSRTKKSMELITEAFASLAFCQLRSSIITFPSNHVAKPSELVNVFSYTA